MPIDKCPDCGYALSIHFRGVGSGSRAGEFLGCPKLVSARMGHADTHPRVAMRVLTTGADKGHVIALWADYIDDQGNVLVWNLTSRDQWMEPQLDIRRRSKRAGRDVEAQAREDVEHEIGGPVRLVRSAHRPR